MDRFEIIRDVDPFANMPTGDGCTYKIMSEKYKGWRIDRENLILDMSENAFNFLLSLKDKKVEVIIDKRVEFFEVLRVITKKDYIDKRTKSKRVKVQFEGQVLLPF